LSLAVVKQPEIEHPAEASYWTPERLKRVNHLLLGCGIATEKRISMPDGPKVWMNLITLDINSDMKPDVVWDMESLPLPFPADCFDEIHAYEILEHTGKQGDFRFFFQQFADFWRMLKPGGHFFATVPMWDSPWAWGDPSHTRVIPQSALVFLTQAEYVNQVGKTSMTDFRRWYQADFELIGVDQTEHQLRFVLKATKAENGTL
jgi:SAM-dependent methyltransferase